MKTYKHVWDTFISHDTIRSAIFKAALGKTYRKDVKRILPNIDQYIWTIEDYANNFKVCDHESVLIKDGPSRKEREIVVPKFREQVIHHMIIKSLQSLFLKSAYRHSYASIPGRGMHNGMKVIKKWIYDRNGKSDVKYILKMDIKKFFNTINHDILKDRFAKYVRDKKLLKIIYQIIDFNEKGLPLGFYTSQWFANWYLQPLDHYIKEELHAVHYMRYMDDMVIFGSNKKKLHKMREDIQKYLEDKLDLTLKANWQVFRFYYYDKKKEKYRGRFLDFMGFRFYRDRIVLRKSIMLKMTRKANKLKKKGKRNVTIYDAYQMMSYLGWVDHADVFQMFDSKVAPYINIKVMKKLISNDFKRKDRHKKRLAQERQQKFYQEVTKSWN